MSTVAPSADYRPIPDVFSHGSYRHWLIARQGNLALYAKTQANGQGPRWEYEVMIIRRRPGRLIFGRSIPAREFLPSDSDFGTNAWALATWERAWELFDEKADQALPRRLHSDLDGFRNSIEIPVWDANRNRSVILKRPGLDLSDVKIGLA